MQNVNISVHFQYNAIYPHRHGMVTSLYVVIHREFTVIACKTFGHWVSCQYLLNDVPIFIVSNFRRILLHLYILASVSWKLWLLLLFNFKFTLFYCTTCFTRPNRVWPIIRQSPVTDHSLHATKLRPLLKITVYVMVEYSIHDHCEIYNMQNNCLFDG